MLAFGCAAQPGDARQIVPGESFELQAGQSAMLESDQLTIVFDGVSTDSRCRKGEVCIWEGDAAVTITLRYRGTQIETHELHTSTRFSNSVLVKGFSIRLVALLPPPSSGRELEPADYVAIFQLTRGPSGHENIS